MKRGLGQVSTIEKMARDGLQFCSKTLVVVGNKSFFIPNLMKVIFGKTVYTGSEAQFHNRPSAHIDLTMRQFAGYSHHIDTLL